MGTAHMKALATMKTTDNVEIVAVSDVYDKRRDAAAQLTGGKPYKDYRALLESKDVDYVLITTPEHWHFQMTMDAIDHGKHIYCEKPMTQTVEQSKRVIAKLKGKKIKMQVGVQGMSDDSYETARKYIKEGVLGNVLIAQIDYSRNYTRDFWVEQDDPDVRPGENLDWKAWLGSAPKHPYDADRFFRRTEEAARGERHIQPGRHREHGDGGKGGLREDLGGSPGGGESPGASGGAVYWTCNTSTG